MYTDLNFAKYPMIDFNIDLDSLRQIFGDSLNRDKKCSGTVVNVLPINSIR